MSLESPSKPQSHIAGLSHYNSSTSRVGDPSLAATPPLSWCGIETRHTGGIVADRHREKDARLLEVRLRPSVLQHLRQQGLGSACSQGTLANAGRHAQQSGRDCVRMGAGQSQWRHGAGCVQLKGLGWWLRFRLLIRVTSGIAKAHLAETSRGVAFLVHWHADWLVSARGSSRVNETLDWRCLSQQWVGSWALKRAILPGRHSTARKRSPGLRPCSSRACAALATPQFLTGAFGTSVQAGYQPCTGQSSMPAMAAAGASSRC